MKTKIENTTAFVKYKKEEDEKMLEDIKDYVDNLYDRKRSIEAIMTEIENELNIHEEINKKYYYTETRVMLEEHKLEDLATRLVCEKNLILLFKRRRAERRLFKIRQKINYLKNAYKQSIGQQHKLRNKFRDHSDNLRCVKEKIIFFERELA